MGAGNSGLFKGTYGANNKVSSAVDNQTNNTQPNHHLIDAKLIQELKDKNIKFTEKDVLFITKDKTGQTVWLEKGNEKAGLEHILNGDGKSPGHAEHFEKAFNISKEQIPTFLNKVISNGRVISNQIKIINGRAGFERIYYHNGKHYVMTGIGTNGFIVSAYPIEYGG